MHVFVTGGSGQTGPTVIADLIRAGHTVTGLARSDGAAGRLQGLGASVHRGSLDDVEALTAGARDAEAVLHMAHGGDFSDPEAMVRLECTAIETLGSALIGSGKPFVSTSGTLVMPTGRVVTEHDAPDPQGLAGFRIPGEQACLGFADQGVRCSVVRLAPTVHGVRDTGFIPFLIAAARRTGTSAYIGDGANRWPTVSRLDAATLFRLALEKAPAGSALHGVGESAVTIKSVAEHIGRALGLPAVSLTPNMAAEHFRNSFLATAFAADAPASSTHTQMLLGWAPAHPTLHEDLDALDYFTPEASTRAEEIWSH